MTEVVLTPEDAPALTWLNKALSTNSPHPHHGLWVRNGKRGLIAYANAYGIILNTGEEDFAGAEREWAWLDPRRAKAAQQVLKGKKDQPPRSIGVQTEDPENVGVKIFGQRQRLLVRTVTTRMGQPVEQYMDVPRGRGLLPDWPHAYYDNGKAYEVQERRIVGDPILFNPPMQGTAAFTRKLLLPVVGERLTTPSRSPLWTFAGDGRMGMVRELFLEEEDNG